MNAGDLATTAATLELLENGLDSARADPDAVLARAMLDWARTYVVEFSQHLGANYEPFQALLAAANSTARATEGSGATATLAELLNSKANG